MAVYRERNYRKKTGSADLISFNVCVKETDLWISAGAKLEREALNLTLESRGQVETYITDHQEFVSSLLPYGEDLFAPPIVKEMIESTKCLGVGPMASVAGAIAENVGQGLLKYTDQVIVENGGDIYLKANRSVTISIFAGESPLNEKLGLLIPQKQMPLGVCSSSGTVGHSLSMGTADAVCLLSPSAALADGAATAIGNRIKKKADLNNFAAWASSIKGILGGVAIMGDRIAAWGEIEMIAL
ncbi:MAG: hypothetical protein B1H11_08430 [Desulfobacteraceae bacterium 4484_190.1]|nr:MAG: hypothetical protein B1H11_08430 [Desulfobacteraceae bacterium 4484_190.1]